MIAARCRIAWFRAFIQQPEISDAKFMPTSPDAPKNRRLLTIFGTFGCKLELAQLHYTRTPLCSQAFARLREAGKQGAQGE